MHGHGDRQGLGAERGPLLQSAGDLGSEEQARGRGDRGAAGRLRVPVCGLTEGLNSSTHRAGPDIFCLQAPLIVA